jgi:hypothetical protein
MDGVAPNPQAVHTTAQRGIATCKRLRNRIDREASRKMRRMSVAPTLESVGLQKGSRSQEESPLAGVRSQQDVAGGSVVDLLGGRLESRGG